MGDGKRHGDERIFGLEATVREKEARGRYGSKASVALKQFGAEVVTFRPLRLLCGESGHDMGKIIQFHDKYAALAWYNSLAYQALLDIRDAVINCRFRLIA